MHSKSRQLTTDVGSLAHPFIYILFSPLTITIAIAIKITITYRITHNKIYLFRFEEGSAVNSNFTPRSEGVLLSFCNNGA